jgi:Holliday junction resolvasome RuvABC endonuclease subunit
MRILALDVATKTGWALYDTDRPPSAIITGHFVCEGKGPFEKVASMRYKLPGILKKQKPDFVAIERPLDRIIQFKKTRKDLLGEEEVSSSINPATVIQLNQLKAAAQTIVMAFDIACCEVAPKTWQTVIPKGVAGRDAKGRARKYCEAVKIEGATADERDAAVIAIWAAGHAQELKLMQRAS